MPFSGKVASLQSVSDLCCLRFVTGKITSTELSQEKWLKVREETVQHFPGLGEQSFEGSVNTAAPGFAEVTYFLCRYSSVANRNVSF